VKYTNFQKELVELASGWLRFIIERPSILSATKSGHELMPCPPCTRKSESAEPLSAAQWCGFSACPLKLPKGSVQENLSHLYLRALRVDPEFVARVRADVPWFPDEVVHECFTGPLTWLANVWPRAKKPRGRPHEPARNFAVAGAIEMIVQTHIAAPAEEGELLLDSEHKTTRPTKAGELKAAPWGLGLTFTEAVKVLSEETPFKPGPLPPRRDGIARRPLTGQALNALAKELQNRVGGRMSRQDISRALEWVKQQRSSPNFRWRPTRARSRLRPRT
jgi:hypothetical protein